jgi:hypothetical protein
LAETAGTTTWTIIFIRGDCIYSISIVNS